MLAMKTYLNKTMDNSNSFYKYTIVIEFDGEVKNALEIYSKVSDFIDDHYAGMGLKLLTLIENKK